MTDVTVNLLKNQVRHLRHLLRGRDVAVAAPELASLLVMACNFASTHSHYRHKTDDLGVRANQRRKHAISVGYRLLAMRALESIAEDAAQRACV